MGKEMARHSDRPIFETLEPRLLLDGSPVLDDVLPLPIDGGTVSLAVYSLTVGVSENLVPDGVNDPASWELRGAGLDDTFDTTDDKIIGLATDPEYVSGTTISLGISPGPLQVGWYRFTAYASLLMDMDGYHLDGDGDGTEGGDYIRTFQIATSPGVTIENTDNDTLATATALPWPFLEDPSGSGNFVGRGLGSIEPSSDLDWWSFEALAGDVISVSVDTPDSDMNPYLELYNAGAGRLVYDHDSGPFYDAFISGYAIAGSGTYYARVSRASATGSYELRVDLARGIDLESDANYANDSIAGADPLTLTLGDPGHQVGTVAGTIMAREGSNTDEDVFLLGTLSAGNVVELNVRLPSTSSWNGVVTVVDASGAVVADEDGNASDGHFLGTVPADGAYYAKVESLWGYNGHTYLLTDLSMNWSDAESYAQSLGGHLATINDQAEQDWVQSTFSPFGGLWNGLNDETEEGTWGWSSGEPVTYTNWASGQPDNSGNEDYVQMWSSDLWYDRSASYTSRGLIELDGVGTGESGAGPWAQYLLDVDVADLVAPTVTGVSPLPADGGGTDVVVDKLTVTLSEDLDPATVNVNNRMVWSHGGHFYAMTNSNVSWGDAEGQAQSLGGHLVTINDQAEQEWVYETFQRFGSVWLGMTDEAVEGTWVWSSGEAVVYTNWASGQPASHPVYDYGYMDSSSGQWYGYGQTGTAYRGIIELEGPDADGDLVPDVLDAYPSDSLNNFDLREAGTDGAFDTSDDAIYRLTLDPTYTTGTSVGLFIQGGPLANGHYRFTANNVLTDRSGNPLDGDGNGMGGDAYQHVFDVAIPSGMTFEGGNNDIRGTATPLPLAEDPAGSGNFIGRGLGSIQPSSDLDWWSFEALAGDVISVSVDTPDSDMNPYLELYNAGAGRLVYDHDSGPFYDAFISGYAIAGSGTYYARVSRASATGSYELRVDLARGIDLESDANYANDSIAGANGLNWATVGTHRTATIAGTIMAPESGNVDEDYFSLGTVQGGETVFLSLRLPESSTLRPIIEIRNSAGGVVSVAPNPSEAVARVDITANGTYYAVVVAMSGQGTRGHYLLDAAVWPTGELEFADLVPSEVAGPAMASSGETVTFTWEVGNYGTGVTDADSWYDRVVLSSNDCYGDGDDVYLGSVRHDGALAVGTPAYASQLEVQLPLGISGDYWVFVEADETKAVFEYIFEGNNIASGASQISIEIPPYGDLAASNVGSPTIGVAGQPYSVTWSVTNLGNGTTGDGTPGGDVAAWTDRIVFSRNTILGDGDDVLVANVPRTGALEAGEGYAGSWTGNLPAGLSGDYHMIVVTDVSDDVYEYMDAESNVSLGTGTVAVAPAVFADLAVTAFTAPAAASVGEQIPVSWTVENTTDAWAATPVSQWHDRVVLSQDAVYGNGDDRTIGEFLHSGALGIGETYDGSGTVTVPTNVSGPYYLFLVTDARGAVYEWTHEGNNASAPASLEVRLPDLEISALADPGSIVVGDAFAVSWTVSNIGSGEAFANWYDRVYLSQDAVLDGGDLALGSAFYRPGHPGAMASYSPNVSVSVPTSYLNEGPHWLIVKTDVAGSQVESSEANNIAMTPVAVSLPPHPDLEVASVPVPASDGWSGQPLEVRWTAANTGDATASGSWLDTVYLSTDGTVDGAIKSVAFARPTALGPGESYEQQVSLTLPNGIEGTYYFVIKVDSQGQVAEFDGEGNNILASGPFQAQNHTCQDAGQRLGQHNPADGLPARGPHGDAHGAKSLRDCSQGFLRGADDHRQSHDR